jgi:hypothetical protein
MRQVMQKIMAAREQIPDTVRPKEASRGREVH